ncbi:redoxin domain-containing protein [Paraburkholderia sp. BCC1885]|uniref:redoxin domain-containing protein n=1 Tax=Paraburkholderia sp. BCC1885 TaxID=2562669 RepID=UPI0011838D5D|nr:redoxin domain-containing protein [Paraburkholderia sp. BCC1885]
MKTDDKLVARIGPENTLPDPLGSPLPRLVLSATNGITVDLAERASSDILVLHPVALPLDCLIPQPLDNAFQIKRSIATLLAFNELCDELESVGISVFGISVQSPEMQRLTAASLELKFPLLSDKHAALALALKLPLIRNGRSPRCPLLVLEARMGRIVRHINPLMEPDGLLETMRRFLIS